MIERLTSARSTLAVIGALAFVCFGGSIAGQGLVRGLVRATHRSSLIPPLKSRRAW